MTRKQAVLQAIDKLSKNPENNEITQKLNELVSEIPYTSWTRDSILDAIENYTIEHNYILPNSKDLVSNNKLPSNTVIKKIFGETSMRTFLNKYFNKYIVKYQSQSQSPYQSYTQEDFKNIFIKNYIRIKNKFYVKTVKVKMYDKYKEKRTPHSCTIIKHCGCNSYNELLILCGFKEVNKELDVSIHISYNDSKNSNEELRKFFDNI